MFIPTIYIENIKPENKSIEVSSNKLHHLKNVLRIRDEDKITYRMEKDSSFMEIL